MSSFSTELRVNAKGREVLRAGNLILEEMGLILEDRGADHLTFKERYRFDPYNPVELDIKVRDTLDGSVIDLEGENQGIGPYQETHVRRIIFELMDKLEMFLSDPAGEEPHMDPDIVRELEMLSRLHSNGDLTDIEFRKAKDRILR